MQVNKPTAPPPPPPPPAPSLTPNGNADIFNGLGAVSPTGGKKLDAISELLAQFRGVAGDESVTTRLA